MATSTGGRRQRLSAPLVVVRRYKLHSRCSGQHVLIVGRHPTARTPLHSDYGNYNYTRVSGVGTLTVDLFSTDLARDLFIYVDRCIKCIKTDLPQF